MSNLQTKIIEIGSKVTIKMNEKIKIITIVEVSKGGKDNCVSVDAMVGKTILGHGIGEVLEFSNDQKRKIIIEILEIE